MMSPRVAEALRHLYPGIDLRYDVEIVDPQDGTGPHIVAWRLPGVPPEEAAIDAALTEIDAAPPPPPPKRQVLKSVITARLIAAGKIGDAMTALMQDPSAFARWIAADHPSIDYDAPDAIALLTQIGADPEVILAP